MVCKKILLILVMILGILSFSVLADESISLNAVPSSGKAPLEVKFDLLSSEPIVSVSWDFDGNGKVDSYDLTPRYTYAAAGKYTASANVTTASGSTLVSTAITVYDPFTVSVVAAPSSGVAPLTVKFTASVSGFPNDKRGETYAWDFNSDGVVDSTEQNPSYTFENVGDFKVTLTVTDTASSFEPSPKITKQIPITVSLYDSKVTIASYFPTSLQLKENQITFIVANNGSEAIKDISAKVIGEGIQHVSSTTIARLKPGEQDSLTIKMNVLKEGDITASVKIDDKIFPLTFAVAQQAKVNPQELDAKIKELKQKLQEQEGSYYAKKADGYLVAEVFDTIKSTKNQLQDAQEKMLTGHLSEAQVDVNLVASAVDDISHNLDDAQKPNQTLLSWLKDNSVAVTAIIAAVGTLSGVAVKLTKGAKKLGEDVVVKFNSKKEKEDKSKPNLSTSESKSKDSEKNDVLEAEEESEDKKD